MRKHLMVGLVGLVAGGLAPAVLAAPTYLALRQESGAWIYGGATSQTIESAFGTNYAALPFSGTTRYDFFSPRLATATALTTSDKGGGTIFMFNSSPSHANDFSVTGRMLYYDYDPRTGNETLISDTGNSGTKNVNMGQFVNWALPNVKLPANWTVPAGHLLHIAVTLTLASGNPGTFGLLVYNGPQTSSTTALLPQNNNQVSWNFSPVGSGRLSICAQSDGCQRLTCIVVPSQTYAVQATTNLAAPVWTTIGSATADSTGSFSFTDTRATNYSVRLYRLATP